MNTEKIIEAGKIAKQTVEYAKTIIQKGTPLLEIAEKIEAKIRELGGKPAFPTNLSINEIAAHYTPSDNDNRIAEGLLKVDLGVSLNGWTSDTAFSLDLENNEENKQLIESAELALTNALKKIEEKGKEITTSEIGKEIQKTIEEKNHSPIINLSGHSMEQNNLHAGITIPNIKNSQNLKLGNGLYAIEPFSTNGNGRVKDGGPSEIYCLIDSRTPRNPKAREILSFIEKEYNTLPFCSRWITKKFGIMSKIILRQLEENSNLHRFPQLIEISGAKVAQAEHTVLIEKGKVTITTI
jgi:methionyl aminopeptidase